jgi:RNase adaptor protein for sRNA GlmZ degradation
MWVDQFGASDFTTLRLYFMCNGGFQRSVWLANHIAKWLFGRVTGGSYQVNVIHLSLRLAQEYQFGQEIHVDQP